MARLPPAPATKAPLSVPRAVPAHYGTNLIELAVCELRFPTVLELESKAPVEFSKAIRKTYPKYERQTDVSLSSTGSVAQTSGHSFHSKDGRWTVSVRPAALLLQTKNYGSFSELRKRLEELIVAAKDTIDSDFFTRIGLRYINGIDYAGDVDEFGALVNEELVAALAKGTLGTVEEYWQRVRGYTGIGGYNFQHGIRARSGEDSRQRYVLDFDFYSEDVEFANAIDVVDRLHELEFSMFRWALGPKTKTLLDSAAK